VGETCLRQLFNSHVDTQILDQIRRFVENRLPEVSSVGVRAAVKHHTSFVPHIPVIQHCVVDLVIADPECQQIWNKKPPEAE
jgi:hypothetical protein